MKYSRIAAVAAAGLLAVTTACSESSAGSADSYPSGPITLTAPSDPGSGFDLTLRTVAEVLDKQGSVDAPLTVQNRPGGLTTTWEKTMITQHEGADDQLSVASLSTILLDVEERSEYTLDDVTLLASLMQENFAIVASAESQYEDLDAVMEALREDPRSVKVASQLEDTLAFALLAAEAGVEASEVTFVFYEGGGEQATGVLNGDVDIAVAGASEFIGLMESGDLKGLAVVGEEPIEGLEVPASAELGYETEFANWRAIVGPPDMPEYAVDYWTDTLEEMTSSEAWAEVAQRHDWTTTFRTGEELQQLVDDTYQQIEDAEENLGRKILPSE